MSNLSNSQEIRLSGLKLLIYVLLNLSQMGRAQESLVCVKVVDEKSGEPIVNALITSGSSRSTTTNLDGVFCLKFADLDNRKIRIQHIGYESLTIDSVTSYGFGNLISLVPKSEVLQLVHVIGKKELNSSAFAINSPINSLSFLPKFLGEPDPIRSLTLYPGVSIGQEGTSGLYVRGGSPSQNLYLIDDVPIYQTSHFFGFISAVNPSSIKRLRLLKGYIPSNYGGRISSVVDIVTKDGNRNELDGEYSFGLLSNTAALEGPFFKDKASFSLSSRFSNLFALSVPASLLFSNDVIDDYASYNMYDINGKFTCDLSAKIKFSANLYLSQDRIPIKQRGSEKIIQERLESNGNTVLSSRFVYYPKPNWSHRAVLYFSKFRNILVFKQFIESDGKNFLLSQGTDLSILKDVGFKYGNDLYLSNKLNITTGFDLSFLSSLPNQVTLEKRDDIFESVRKNRNDVYEISTRQIAPYTTLTYDRGSTIIELGVRLSYYYYLHFRSQSRSFEPRLSLTKEISTGITTELSYTKLSQPIHLLISPTSRLPSETWVVASDDFPASNSHNFSIDSRKTFKWGAIGIAAYYRALGSLVEYRRGVQFRFDLNSDYTKKISGSGKGRAKGVELSVRHRSPMIATQLSATFSRSERQFSDINGGEWIRARFDRFIDLSINSILQISKTHLLSLNIVYNSGYPVTLPSFYYMTLHRGIKPAYRDRFNEEAPDYFRIDLQLTKNYQTKRNKDGYWSLGIYNVFFHVNPAVVAIDGRIGINESMYADASSLSKYKRSYFTFLPAVTVGRKFKN